MQTPFGMGQNVNFSAALILPEKGAFVNGWKTGKPEINGIILRKAYRICGGIKQKYTRKICKTGYMILPYTE